MKFTRREDKKEFSTIYKLQLFEHEVVRANFSRIDLELMKECTKSDKISDKLLMLEMIARRIEEKNHDRQKSKIAINKQ